MGYLTEHSLAIDPGTHSPQDIFSTFCADFAGIDTGLDLHLDKNPLGKGYFLSNLEPVKWYREKEQMSHFSTRFPTATFIVHGEGEDRDDVWEHRYRNGLAEERFQAHDWKDWQIAFA